MMIKRSLSAYQKQIRFLTVMSITTAMALFAVIYWVSISKL